MASTYKRKIKIGKRQKKVMTLVKEIVQYLNENSDESMQLWDILTALRGPDITPEGFSGLKARTTAVLRRKIGLKYIAASTIADSADAVLLRKRLYEVYVGRYVGKSSRPPGWSGHFVRHIQDAFSAVGMTWGDINT